MNQPDDQKAKRRPIWQAEQDYPDLCKTLEEKLDDVKDPELSLSVIELGLIRDVIIRDQDAQVEMILTTPFCPYAPMMLEAARAKSEEVLQRPTHIILGTEIWDASMAEEDLGEWGMYY